MPVQGLFLNNRNDLKKRREAKHQHRAAIKRAVHSAFSSFNACELLETRQLLAAFGAGHLAVIQSNAQAATGTGVSIVEYLTSGDNQLPVQTIALPTTTSGSNLRLVQSGTGPSEGFLTLSQDKRFLLLAGYNAAVGSTVTTGVTDRVIGLVDADGNVNTSTHSTNFTNSGIRSAASADGTSIYVANSGGIHLITAGGTNVSPVYSNDTRSAVVFDNQLYGSNGTSIVRVETGLPTSTATATTLSGVSLTNSNSYVFLDRDGIAGPEQLYVTETVTPNSPIRKFVLSNGNWIARGSVSITGVGGLFGLAATVNEAGGVDLYMTTGGGVTGGNKLIKYTDTSTITGTMTATTLSPQTVLAVAPASRAFRGVSFVPEKPNTAPVVVTNHAKAVNEGALNAVLSSVELSILDAEQPAGSLTYTITTGPVNGVIRKDGLVTSQFTQADIDAGLITYSHNGSETVSDSFAFTVSDGAGGGVSGTFNIAVLPVNDAPTVTMPTGEYAGTVGTPVTFGAGTSNAFSLNDVDAGAGEVTATISLSGVPGSLTLASLDGLTPVNIAASGSSVLSFNGTVSAWTAALNRGLTFVPAGHGTAYISFSVNDNGNTGFGGALAASTSMSIAVAAAPVVHVAPVAVDATINMSEDGVCIFTAGDFVFTDADSPADALHSVLITSLPAQGVLSYNGLPIPAASVANPFVVLAANLNLLRFDSAANEYGLAYATFNFRVRDTGGTANGGTDTSTADATISINVTSMPDAPAGADQTVNTFEDTAYTFSVADFGFSDPNDSPVDEFLSVTISTLPAKGVLELDGAPIAAGQTIAVRDLVAGLLKYIPTPDASGDAYTSFTFQVQDSGSVLSGGVNLDSSPNFMSVNVAPVNDAPIGGDRTISATKAAGYVFTPDDFSLTDMDAPPNGLAAVKVVAMPALGTLTLNGAAVEPGQVIPAQDIAAGLLRFTAGAGDGLSYASFTFQVQDDGGVANGGIDLDPTPNTITIDVFDPTVLQIGDIAFTGYQASDPDRMSFLLLRDIKAGTVLTITDDGWQSTNNLASSEGSNTITFRAAFSAGTQFNYDASRPSGSRWSVGADGTNISDVTTGNFLFASLGDNLFAFSGTTAPSSSDSPLWVAAFSTSAFLTTGNANTNTTYLPSAFTIGDSAFSLGVIQNAVLNFPSTTLAGTAARIRSSVYTRSNWSTFAAAGGRAVPPSTTFQVNASDAPAGTDGVVSGMEDIPYVLTPADFGFIDPNNTPADMLLGVEITTLPAAGTLANNGLHVRAGDFISATDIALGSLIFIAAPNASGTAYATFTFRVRDNGGTASGTQDTASTPNTLVINIARADDTPADITLSSSTILENEPAGTVVGRLSTADSDVGDTFTYNLVSGVAFDDNGLFYVDGDTLRARDGFDYEAKGTYHIHLRSTDSSGLYVEKDMAITVGDVNESPIVGRSAYAFTINSKAVNGSSIAVLDATDPDASPALSSLSWSIVSGNAAGAFAIDAATGRLSVLNATKLPKIPAGQTQATAPQLVVQVTDGALAMTASAEITVSSNERTAPIAAARGTTFALAENHAASATAAVVAGVLSYTGQTLGNWSVSDTPGGPPSSIFTVKSSTATGATIALMPDVKLNFEQKASHTFYVTVSDGQDPTKVVTTAVTLNVTDTNEAPRLSLTDGVAGAPTTPLTSPTAGTAKYTINEYTTITTDQSPKNGDVVFTLNASDDDQSSTSLTYVLAGAGVTNPAPGVYIDKSGALRFDAATGQVTIIDASKLDYEKFKAGISLAFAVTDNGLAGTAAEGTASKPLLSKATVTVLLADLNDTPTFATPALLISRVENNKPDTIIAKVRATSGDSVAAELNYSIISVINGVGEDVSGLFSVDPATGAIAVLPGGLFNFESPANSKYIITVRATELYSGYSTNDSATGDQRITLAITDANDAAKISLVDGSAGAAIVPLTSPTAGTAKYAINEYTTITAASHPKNGDILFTLYADDDDQSSGSLTYALAGTGVTNPSAGIYIDRSGGLLFDAATGEVKIIDSTKLDFEKFRTGLTLAFAVTDNGLAGTASEETTARVLTSKATVMIMLNDLNDTPTFATPALTVAKAENNAANLVIATAKARSGDLAATTLTYSLVSVENGLGEDVLGLFAINPNTGAITVLQAKLFDFESLANRKFVFTVCATEEETGISTSDSAIGDQVITLNITDLNEAPLATFTPVSPGVGSASSGTTGALQLNLPAIVAAGGAGTVVGILALNDPDGVGNGYGPDSVVVTSVVDSSSTTAPALTFDPATGELKVNNLATLQAKIGRSFTVKITIKDKGGDPTRSPLTTLLTLTVNVTNVPL